MGFQIDHARAQTFDAEGGGWFRFEIIAPTAGLNLAESVEKSPLLFAKHAAIVDRQYRMTKKTAHCLCCSVPIETLQTPFVVIRPATQSFTEAFAAPLCVACSSGTDEHVGGRVDQALIRCFPGLTMHRTTTDEVGHS